MQGVTYNLINDPGFSFENFTPLTSHHWLVETYANYSWVPSSVSRWDRIQAQDKGLSCCGLCLLSLLAGVYWLLTKFLQVWVLCFSRCLLKHEKYLWGVLMSPSVFRHIGQSLLFGALLLLLCAVVVPEMQAVAPQVDFPLCCLIYRPPSLAFFSKTLRCPTSFQGV